MRKTILLVLFTIISISTIAQVFEGNVAEYSDRYDMSKIESYSRINANGGMNYNRKGFIAFKFDKIVFGIGKSYNQEEVYMELDFEYEVLKNGTVFNDIFSLVPTFIMKNDEGKQVIIEYFTFEPFSGMDGGQFVISIDNKMYFIEMKEDVFSTVVELYKE